MGLLLCRLVMIDSVILLRLPDSSARRSEATQVDKAKWDETGQQVTERRDLSQYTTLSGATGATATPKAKATSRKSKRPVKQQHRIATTRAQRLANSRCAAEKRLVRRTRTRGPKRSTAKSAVGPRLSTLGRQTQSEQPHRSRLLTAFIAMPKCRGTARCSGFRSTKQVIVILRWLWAIMTSEFGATEGSIDQPPQKVVPYVIPNHTLESNSATCIGGALRKWRPASRKRLLQRSNTKVLLELRESDAASANLTHVASQCHRAIDYRNRYGLIVLIHFLCLLHQLHLAAGVVIELAGGPSPSTPSIISILYCASRVLRTPGYWAKMLGCVPTAVRYTLVAKDSGWLPSFRTHWPCLR